jgi:hypothetical protein
MTAMKTSLFGAVSLAIMASGSLAADMMMDLKTPREPVYRCDIKGFIELPGTDICFNIGGHARLVVLASEDQWYGDEGLTTGDIVPDGHKLTDTLQMYGQGRVKFDARTATEYGTVRAYIEMQADDNDSRTGGNFRLRHAFVQFGNWTFGKAYSTFLHRASTPDYSDPFNVAGDNSIRRSQIRYTADFGGGVSLAVAAEDQNYNTPAAINAAGLYFTPSAPNSVVNDRNEIPDAVAHINVEGDWGSAQLSGALHANRFREVSAAGTAPAPLTGQQTDSKIGWAVLFGIAVNAPSLGEDDEIMFKAMYTDGATQYNQDNYLGTTNVVWGLCDVVIPAQGGCIVDTVVTWSLLAGYTHSWSPTWYSTFGIGYQNIDAPLTVANTGLPVGASDFAQDVYEVFGNIVWNPQPGTEFMLDVHYGHVDFNGTGTFAGTFSPFVENPLADDNDGAFAAAFQVTRSF